ncbi:MAG: glycosyltransferase family 2 protein [Pseudomonadota bacterium]|nr:glycosyltransferase family 2 protein [Pseudomonadota bacterium]
MRKPVLGVVIVTYNSEDIILDCLESLLSSGDPDLRIVVVDNASPDATVSRLREWAAGTAPYTPPADSPFSFVPAPKPLALIEGQRGMAPDRSADVTLLHSGRNAGYAGGVNAGLAYLAQFEEVDDFWILNPDSMVPGASIAALKQKLATVGEYGMIGGRVNYLERPDRIQIDGGTISLNTGVTGNINLGKSHRETPPPDAGQLDFITGASLVASRKFYETVGPMIEDYFLYYEEVDWALRRGDLPLIYCDGFLAYHRAGTSIGSPTFGRIASPFSHYFKYRSRMMFLRRLRPWRLPLGYGYAMAKAAQIMAKGHAPEAWAVVAAVNGLAPPRNVRGVLSPDTAEYVFGRSAGKDTGKTQHMRS